MDKLSAKISITDNTKVLNCFAGIGGNRKLWKNVEVTAVEIDPKIAEIYQDYFPNDKVIIGDAHDYLLKHYEDYDLVWASPPCPTHSKLRYLHSVKVYPDMMLYQEILLLKHFARNNWVVENVQPYYEPLISARKLGCHLIWSNKTFNSYPRMKGNPVQNFTYKDYERKYNYNLDKYKIGGGKKRKLLRNCVEPELGLYILNTIRGAEEPIQEDLFSKGL